MTDRAATLGRVLFDVAPDNPEDPEGSRSLFERPGEGAHDAEG
jgi:hypothetical protein